MMTEAEIEGTRLQATECHARSQEEARKDPTPLISEGTWPC
jgi:hypothetical protein